VRRATLRLLAKNSGPRRFRVHKVRGNSWREGRITYGNAPSPGGVIAAGSSSRTGGWTAIDLTSLIRGNGVFSLALTSSSRRAIVFASRESGRTAPQLVIATEPPAPGPPPVVVAAAGDIACDSNSPDFNGGLGTPTTCRQKYTADLLGGASAVFALGDNQYETGRLAQYQRSYDLSWGRFKPITRPTPGNHEYYDWEGGAKGYFDYFGAAASERGKGYYSYDLGAWHIVVLNSNCAYVNGCRVGSPQEVWLRSDLAAHRVRCTLAYWHHPRFATGRQGNYAAYQPFWQALYEHRAEVVLAGHDHNYQRYAPLTPTGSEDRVRGIREFVVGTGGRSHEHLRSGLGAHREAGNDNTFGVLRLTLYGKRYAWKFVPEAGSTFTDSGSAACH